MKIQVVAIVFELLNLLPILLPRKDSQSEVGHGNGYTSIKPKFVCMGVQQSKDKFHCVEPAKRCRSQKEYSLLSDLESCTTDVLLLRTNS